MEPAFEFCNMSSPAPNESICATYMLDKMLTEGLWLCTELGLDEESRFDD